MLQGYAFQMEIVVRARGLSYSISEVRSGIAEPRASVHLGLCNVLAVVRTVCMAALLRPASVEGPQPWSRDPVGTAAAQQTPNPKP